MSLVRDVLSVIKSEWPGGIPSDVRRIDQSDAVVLETGRDATSVDETTTRIYVGLESEDRVSLGAGPDDGVTRTIPVVIRALPERERGSVADHGEFRGQVRAVKTALRTEASPQGPQTIGVNHPTTWHELYLENEQETSTQHADHYGTSFDIRLRGHR